MCIRKLWLIVYVFMFKEITFEIDSLVELDKKITIIGTSVNKKIFDWLWFLFQSIVIGNDDGSSQVHHIRIISYFFNNEKRKQYW